MWFANILPFIRLPFHFVDGFLHCAKAYKFVLVFCFFFIFPLYSKGVRLSLHCLLYTSVHSFFLILSSIIFYPKRLDIVPWWTFFFFNFGFFFFFIFPLYSKGDRLSLHVYIAITVFPPPFLLLQHEYLDIVLNAIQQDLLVNLF